MHPLNPEFDQRRKERDREQKRAQEIERAYVGALVDAPEGRWLIKQLILRSRCLQAQPASGHSLVHETILDRVVDQFGYAGIDRILKG